MTILCIDAVILPNKPVYDTAKVSILDVYIDLIVQHFKYDKKAEARVFRGRFASKI